MKRNFAASLKHVLKHEGGYVDHPRDPGGATNMGITHRVLASWRKVRPYTKLPKSEIKALKMEEVSAIYKARYWDKVRGDQLPSGVDYAVFDFAVNSGPSRAVKFTQRIVGVTPDGKLGPQTLAAINSYDASKLITMLCSNRLMWLRRLKTFKTFGKGWTRRVDGVLSSARSITLAPTQTPVDAPKRASRGIIQIIIELFRKLLGRG